MELADQFTERIVLPQSATPAKQCKDAQVQTATFQSVAEKYDNIKKRMLKLLGKVDPQTCRISYGSSYEMFKALESRIFVTNERQNLQLLDYQKAIE